MLPAKTTFGSQKWTCVYYLYYITGISLHWAFFSKHLSKKQEIYYHHKHALLYSDYSYKEIWNTTYFGMKYFLTCTNDRTDGWKTMDVSRSNEDRRGVGYDARRLTTVVTIKLTWILDESIWSILNISASMKGPAKNHDYQITSQYLLHVLCI